MREMYEMLDELGVCHPECWSEYGPGWHALIRGTLERMLAAGWDGRLGQIKEKFGGLRIYIDTGNDAVWKIIDEAEALSFKTCEFCGRPGRRRSGGWIKVRCDECEAAREGKA